MLAKKIYFSFWLDDISIIVQICNKSLSNTEAKVNYLILLYM